MAGHSACRGLRQLALQQRQAGVHASLLGSSSVAFMQRMVASDASSSTSAEPAGDEATRSLRAAFGYCIHQVK